MDVKVPSHSLRLSISMDTQDEFKSQSPPSLLTAGNSEVKIEPQKSSTSFSQELLPILDQDMRTDMLATLREKEARFYIYNAKAKYVKFRRVIVDWMCEVAEDFKLTSTTIHMAIQYLDRILSTVDVAKNKLQLVSMCCILVAAKYEEKDDNVPSVEELNECADNTYTTVQIKEMEIMVLNKLEWNLGVVVPDHFLKHYFDQGLVFRTDLVNGGVVTKRAVRYLKKYLDFFSDLCQQEHSFQQYRPSVVAAAVIVCARNALKFHPVWNQELANLSQLDEQALLPCYLHLWTYYEKNFPTSRTSGISPVQLPETKKQQPPCPISPISPLSPISPPIASPAATSPTPVLSPLSPASSPSSLTELRKSLLPIACKRERDNMDTHGKHVQPTGPRLNRYQPYARKALYGQS